MGADPDKDPTSVRYCRRCTKPFAETAEVLRQAKAFCSEACERDDGWPRCRQCGGALSERAWRQRNLYCDKRCYRAWRGRYEAHLMEANTYNTDHRERVAADRWSVEERRR